MNDLKEQIAKQLHEAQAKYTYFLLAAAGAGIALAIQQTAGLPLNWGQLPLGLAILSWGASFWSGCYNRAYFHTTLIANVAFLQLKDGDHPKQPPTPNETRGAIEGTSIAAERNSSSANRWGNRQFRLLILGAIFFLCWHIIEMARKPSGSSDGRCHIQNEQKCKSAV